ncbi:MAG: sodium-dependent transporter [Simkaniaceae bacterium]
MSQIREHWSSRLGFLFAAIGSAVGLGILWKFPYTVGQNGGGLFLLAYFGFVILVGIPVFIAEIILGKNSQRAAVGAFTVLHPKGSTSWQIAGWLGILASFLIMSFYSVIAGWGMSYVLMSLTGFYKGLSSDEISQVYWNLSKSGNISVLWHFFFTGMVMGIVLAGVRKGIEYWAKIMTKVLLVLLFILFAYSVTLDGFKQAAHFVFYPDFDKFSFSSCLEALGLAFFTLSLGQGIMISYGSYMKRSENIIKMSFIVALSLIIVAILAALTIFPVVFTFNLPPQAGEGLVFQTLPYLFAKLPGSLVLSTMFFSLFVFTALTSAIPLIEVVATNLMELFGISRKRAVLMVSAAAFVFGIPSAYSGAGKIFPNWEKIYGSNFLTTVNNFVSIWIIPIAGLLTSIFVGWIMEKRISSEEFRMAGKYFRVFWILWRFFIRYLVPILILAIILQKSGLLDFF